MMFGGEPIKVIVPQELEIELEMDEEWMKVRAFRQEQFEKAGISDFTSFRLALDPEVNWHKVIDAFKAGLSEDALVDVFL